MADRTAAARQRRRREAIKNHGLVAMRVLIPDTDDARAEIVAAAKKISDRHKNPVDAAENP